MPFLRFDPAEIFSVLAFLVFGPIPALITAAVHWLFLTTTSTGSTAGLGPAVKFAAVLSTLFGMWLGSVVYRRSLTKYQKLSTALVFMLTFAILTRVGFLLIVNYAVFTYIGPIFGIKYIEFGQRTLQATLGIDFASSWDVLMAMLVYTSIFNALHATFSVLIPYFIFTPLTLKIPQIASGHPWISRFTTK